MTEAIVYLHGGPGSPGELELFSKRQSDARLPFFAPDRFARQEKDQASIAFDQLANDCVARFPKAKLHLIGFSLGGFVALELAARLKDRVSKMDLIAPAAPLEGGPFLEGMAGKALFAIARDRPTWLPTILRAQGLLARRMPTLLYRLLFCTSAGDDRALVSDPHFKSQILTILQSCFFHPPTGFAQELRAYVKPWAHILPEILPPVSIWHGTEDNWAPFAMAEYLVSALPQARLETIEGASHYSALRFALTQLDLPT